MSDDILHVEMAQENAENSHDALFAQIQSLQANNVAARQALEEERCKNARSRVFMERALEACRNTGRGNEIVAERVIERVEEELLSGLGRNNYAADWQPIVTAPTDGKPILGWSDEGVSYVCWHDRGKWTFFKDHRGNTWHFEPTKWMPHPAFPMVTH